MSNAGFHASITSTKATARVCLTFLFIAVACLDPYVSPSMKDLNLLVVDGFLNTGDGIARVKLSRSLPLDAATPYPRESGATVTVESENGTRFGLPETSSGNYETIRNDLHAGTSYRLLITTAFDETFESDFVTLKQSPTLEEVSWRPDGDGITIFVDSRDPSGDTRYYQWLYTETWEYDADKYSQYYVKGGRAVIRKANERIHICYTTQQSSKVLISTTSDQSGDVINDFPLIHIPRGSKKVCRTYSVLVQQRALDKKSFDYWSQLQKTTENLGGLFDPMPTELTGNIRSTQLGGPTVLGYFNGGGVEEKRIYIRFTELPEELQFVNRRWCSVDTIQNASAYPEGTPLVGEFTIANVVGQILPSDICVDCRLEGGTLTKPSFWPF